MTSWHVEMQHIHLHHQQKRHYYSKDTEIPIKIGEKLEVGWKKNHKLLMKEVTIGDSKHSKTYCKT